MVASPTVTVSFWINVSVAVTVMKMEVVMPSTLVLVVLSPSPPLAATWLPFPMVVVAVVAGVGSWWVLDEVVVWCLTGMTARGASESSDDEEVVGAWFSVAVMGVASASTGDGVAVVFVEEEEVVVVSALDAEPTVIVVLGNSVVDDDDGWAFSVLVSSGSFVTEERKLDVVDGAFSSEVVVVVEDELEGVSFSVTELVVVDEEEEVTVSTPAFPPVEDRDVVVSLGSIDEDDEDDVDVVASPEGVTVTCFVDEGTVTVTTPPPPPPVAEILCAVEDVVCWLEKVSVVVAAGGVTVTWTVEEGTVTVTTSPAPVALCSVVVEEEDELRVVEPSCSLPEGVSLGVVEEVKVVGEKKPVTLLVVPSFAPLAPGVTTSEPSVGVGEAELSVDVVAVAPAGWAVTVLFAGDWRAVPVGSLAVEVEEVCKDCVEATAEGVADCSVDSVANPDGPKEVVAEESALACCSVEVKAEPVVLRPKVEDNWAEESSGVVEEVVEEDWRVVLESVGAESPTEELVAVDGPLTGTTENGES